MKRSDTSKDFERIQQDEHVEIVIKAIDEKTNKYFKRITSSLMSETTSAFVSEQFVWSQVFSENIEKYNKDAKPYLNFFSEESMDEFEEIDDPKAFKSELKKDCPIIRKSLMSKLEEMQEWKEQFTCSKPNELLDAFANFLDFARNYVSEVSKINYDDLHALEDFKELCAFSEDPDYGLQSVIGAGIKTTVLYNLNPQYLNKSVRRTLYGLYFLTIDIHEILPSRTSEFIMMDDTKGYASKRGSSYNLKIEHNYWYPFNLFMFYSKYIYDKLIVLFKDLKINLDTKYRYVYVNIFLELICKEHQEAIKTMMGGDQDL
ncbi:hypothetical protein [uncultured Draconibacterium sp.]|uniref:hypothetical protein n=1 Tax=uncultured Draconibacterium sp. TaxID=1573823 RepID=UPI0032604765